MGWLVCFALTAGTSAAEPVGVGGARSYDPSLHLVEEIYGVTVAKGVVRGMVLEWDRDRIRHLAIGLTAR